MAPVPYLGFNEGKDRIFSAGGGLPANFVFGLVRNPLAVDPNNPNPGELSPGSKYSLDLSEASGAGYSRISFATPAPSNGIITIDPVAKNLSWTFVSGGPTNIYTLMLFDAPNNLFLYAWDLTAILTRNGGAAQPGAPIDVSTPNSRIDLTNGGAASPFHFFLQNVGGN